MVQEDLERRGEPWSWGWPLELDNDNQAPSLKLDPPQLHKKLPKNLTLAILQSFGTWSKLEKWKSDKWVPHELTVNQKNHRFESSSSLVPDKNNEQFLDQTVTCNEKWVLYKNWQWSAQWLDWEEPPKHFPKWNLYQKRSLSLFDGLLPVWSTTAFWIPVKPLHVRRLLSKSKRCTGNCKAYTWYWSTERAQFICMTAQWVIATASKVEQIGLRSFASTATLTWLLANWLPLLQPSQQDFAGKMLPQPAGDRKRFRRVSWILKHEFLHHRNKQTNFLWAKMYWL